MFRLSVIECNWFGTRESEEHHRLLKEQKELPLKVSPSAKPFPIPFLSCGTCQEALSHSPICPNCRTCLAILIPDYVPIKKFKYFEYPYLHVGPGNPYSTVTITHIDLITFTVQQHWGTTGKIEWTCCAEVHRTGSASQTNLP